MFFRFLNVFCTILIIFNLIFPNKCYESEEIKIQVDYLATLINATILSATKYQQRTSNSDFFQNLNKDKVEDYGEFDFIVVGAGSSGSVVANRLSENPRWKILLLEAGNVDDDLTDIPFIYTVLQLTDKNWGYMTTPQKNGCLGRNNNQCPYPRGKVLGGSGSINAFSFSRGNKEDYDKWGKDNPGWSYKQILPLFKKMENYDSEKIDLRYRGFAGPLTIAHGRPLTDDFNGYLSANEELGLTYNEDYNAKTQIGTSRLQLNIKHGRRSSGATAYVRPVWDRFNFNLTLQAYVTKILIDNYKTAKGVEFVKGGQIYRARAKKEVILSAGAVNTPQLLMLSGIGPKEELDKHQIPIVKNLPVGKRLDDQYSVTVTFATNVTTEVIPFETLLEMYLNGVGALTNLNHIIGLTYFNTRNKNSSVPNMQILFDFPSQVCRGLPFAPNWKPDITEFLQNITSCSDWGASILLLHPRSYGSLKLQSNNPVDFPLIDIGIFNNKEDIQELYEGVEYLRRLIKTKTAKPIKSTLPIMPFCSQHNEESKEYWYCVIQNMAFPLYHISGTTRMGRRKDALSVVNHKLEVYGFNKLRIADLGVMPSTISANPNSVAFLIGEKAAEIIKNDYS